MGYSKLTYEHYLEHPDFYTFEAPIHADALYEKGYVSVSAIDFYDDIFGEDLETHRMPDDYTTGEYGGLAFELVNRKNKKPGEKEYYMKRYTVTKGNSELYELINRSDNFCMISPVSYAGKNKTIKNARYLYAMCIEVDDIVPNTGINELIHSWERKFQPIPQPTYMVCSGTGLHLYYVFERPIPLWANVFKTLSEAKKEFTKRIWTNFVTNSYNNIQYEGIVQNFRCVGSVTKKGTYVMAFQTGEKVTIEYMNGFLPEDKKILKFYKSSCSIEEAKKLYPDWYNRCIQEGRGRGHWQRYAPIYYNWIEKLLSGVVVVGHRYNCLENLCSLAVQCNISPEQVEKDCRRIAEKFEELTISEENHFTEYDICCALRTYYEKNDGAYRRRIDYIQNKTGIELIPNKRNGKSQAQHLKVARFVRDLNYEETNGWANKDGAPKKHDIVKNWRKEHPNGKKADCIRDTKLSKPTVYKWWNEDSLKKAKVSAIQTDDIKDMNLELNIREDLMNNMLSFILNGKSVDEISVWLMDKYPGLSKKEAKQHVNEILSKISKVINQ